jgi:DnaJ-class molecular chaperone
VTDGDRVRDLYHDLGVSPEASPKALRAALEWVRSHRVEASGSYRVAVQAYAILSDPQARLEYDRSIGIAPPDDGEGDASRQAGVHRGPRHADDKDLGHRRWIGILLRKTS